MSDENVVRAYLIRHGRQCSALCNVDVDLSDEGHRQAELTGKRLKGYGIQAVYTSELIRARQTAEHISRELKLPVNVVEHIEEMHFGDWTGLSDSELDAKYKEERIAHKMGNNDIRYAGGENGQECSIRFRQGMEWIIKDAKKNGYKSIAIVTHGMAMRAYLCSIIPVPFSKRGLLARQLENCSITELLFKDGLVSLERFNDYAHLEPYDELLRKHFKVI